MWFYSVHVIGFFYINFTFGNNKSLCCSNHVFLRNLDRCHKNMMNWNRKKPQSNRLLKQEVLSMNIINIYSLDLDTVWGTIYSKQNCNQYVIQENV